MSPLRWRSHYWFNENASKFHESFRQFLLNEPRLQHLNCYQEVNVQDLIPSYPFHNHYYDWYIEQLDLIIELHGAQHYKPANYGNVGRDTLLSNFREIRSRDKLKAQAAAANGFTYIALPYKVENKLSYELLVSSMEKANEDPST